MGIANYQSSVFSIGFLNQAGDRITFETFPVVNRDQVATSITLVFQVLFRSKLFDAYLTDPFKVLHHAHSVIFPIPLIHAFNPLAGILVTFVAKYGIAGRTLVDSRTSLK